MKPAIAASAPWIRILEVSATSEKPKSGWLHTGVLPRATSALRSS